MKIRYLGKIKCVKISSVGKDFEEFLFGRQKPILSDDYNPEGWAYYRDYEDYQRIHNNK